jgi:hypothetical protein
VDETDRLLADLARWSADRRADDAARSREGEGWLRRQAEEEARFTGVALDLAEQQDTVTVRTTVGRQHHGRVVAVAEDFLVVHTAGGAPVLLPYAAIAVLRPSPGATAPDASSARLPLLGTRLVQALAGMAADRPRVAVVVHGGEATSGELRAVGTDVLTVRLDAGATVYVRADAVAEVTVFG